MTSRATAYVAEDASESEDVAGRGSLICIVYRSIARRPASGAS